MIKCIDNGYRKYYFYVGGDGAAGIFSDLFSSLKAIVFSGKVNKLE